MKARTRLVADILIGVLTATSTVWVDVNFIHRLMIGILVTFAMETLFVWLDNRSESQEEADDAEIQRKERNRQNIFSCWVKERL